MRIFFETNLWNYFNNSNIFNKGFTIILVNYILIPCNPNIFSIDNHSN